MTKKEKRIEQVKFDVEINGDYIKVEVKEFAVVEDFNKIMTIIFSHVSNDKIMVSVLGETIVLEYNP